MKNVVSLQELATFLRDVAYGDHQVHDICWRLDVLHPSTNDGVVGFAGGLWHRTPWFAEKVTLDFSYDEVRGITNCKCWVNDMPLDVNKEPTFDEFKVLAIEKFRIKYLYATPSKGKASAMTRKEYSDLFAK